MSYGNNGDFFRGFSDNNIVRETLECESFDLPRSSLTSHGRKRDDFLTRQVEGATNYTTKLQARPGALLLLPGNCFDCLFSRFFKYPYSTHDKLLSRSSVCRLNSS